MSLHAKLQQRAADNKPIRIGLIGNGGRCGVAARYAMYLPSPVTNGVHSSPLPGVITTGCALSTGTFTMCRRSTSSASVPALPAKTMYVRSALIETYSAM